MDIEKLKALALAKNLPYLEAFFAKFRIQGECWQWIASTSGRPGRMYGCFWNGKIIKAHRFAFETWNGPLESDKIICHRCDNPLCVNPAHLYQGTHHDNVMDAVKRQRHKNGQAQKTHCPRNHPYTGDNVYEHKGTRQCKTCKDIFRGRKPKAYF
jgi:hypothetical protein